MKILAFQRGLEQPADKNSQSSSDSNEQSSTLGTINATAASSIEKDENGDTACENFESEKMVITLGRPSEFEIISANHEPAHVLHTSDNGAGILQSCIELTMVKGNRFLDVELGTKIFRVSFKQSVYSAATLKMAIISKLKLKNDYRLEINGKSSLDWEGLVPLDYIKTIKLVPLGLGGSKTANVKISPDDDDINSPPNNLEDLIRCICQDELNKLLDDKMYEMIDDSTPISNVVKIDVDSGKVVFNPRTQLPTFSIAKIDNNTANEVMYAFETFLNVDSPHTLLCSQVQ